MPEPDPIQASEDANADASIEFHAPETLARLWRWSRLTLQIGLPLLVLWLVWHEIHALNIHRVREAVAQAHQSDIVLGLVCTFAALAVMGLYDAIAFPRGRNGSLSFRRRWLLGSVVFGWTNFISMGPMGGPALRLIAYRRFGLTGPEITRGFVGHSIASTAGLMGFLAGAWVPLPFDGSAGLALRFTISALIAVAAPHLAGLLLVPIIRRHRFGSDLAGLPLARLGMVSFVEWGLTLVAFVFFVRSVGVGPEWAEAARTVFTGQAAGLASMIPGGLGSADAVWLKGFTLLGETHDTALAAIVIFRAGFYMTPWVLSLGVIYTVLAMQSARVRLWQRRLVAGAVMLSAVMLLISAATPALRDRLDAVAKFVPLGAIEASHAIAAVSAALLLLVVRGLLRGYRAAYVMTAALLVASVIVHPLKGGDYEEAFVSLVLLVLLFGVRGAFTRRGRIPIGWEVILAVSVGAAAIFLVSGFAAFERIPYRNDMWTTFADKAEASRFLRASVLIMIIGIAAAARQAMRPVRVWVTPTGADIDRAEAFVRAHAASADGLLVGGGDKGVWFYEPKEGKKRGLAGVVLYQRAGSRLIVFEDPIIAPGVDPAGLIGALLRFADELDVEIVFSAISSEWMGRLHDFGFHFLKVNEEAIVTLTGFTLGGGANAGFRRTLRDMEQAGIRYEVLTPPFDDKLIDELRTVSDAWLAGKGARELQFSACCFSPAYIRRNPLGVARDASGAVIAFVNILTPSPSGCATLDFMRYIPDRAEGLMDFAIIRTMQTLAEQGYAQFSLGAAPLSDVGIWPGSRPAERMLHLYSTKAERVYNYRGVLQYKTKFHPQWEPRFLAFERPWDWAGSLIASARLVQARSRADRRRIAAARIGREDTP